MITDTLLRHPWLGPTAFAVSVAFGPFVGVWLVRRRRLAWFLTGVAILPVLSLTLVPTDRVTSEYCSVQWSLPTPSRVELFANVVLFIAPVLAAGVASRRPAMVLLAASVLAAALEASQALIPALGRSCDTNDWLSNSIGAAVGALLALIALATARRNSFNLAPRQAPGAADG